MTEHATIQFRAKREPNVDITPGTVFKMRSRLYEEFGGPETVEMTAASNIVNSHVRVKVHDGWDWIHVNEIIGVVR